MKGMLAMLMALAVFVTAGRMSASPDYVAPTGSAEN